MCAINIKYRYRQQLSWSKFLNMEKYHFPTMERAQTLMWTTFRG